MTCIAWDGKTLAADKRASLQGYAVPVTKIFRVNGMLVGGAGDFNKALEVVEWVKSGADPDKLPAFQRTDDWVGLVCITPDKKILRYERGPLPFVVEAPFFAIGSGRDYAIAAMHLGKSAKEAVEIACIYETGCGNGIDALTLD